MKHIFITETGCPYEGGAFLEAFYTFDEALASKPSSYNNQTSQGPEFFKWLTQDGMDFFSITKAELFHKSKTEIKTCPCCKQTFFRHQMAHLGKYCSDCFFWYENFYKGAPDWVENGI